MWLIRCSKCRVLLGCKVVAMVFRMFCRVLLGCEEVGKVYRMVSKLLLGCSVWLIKCSKFFQGVARV